MVAAQSAFDATVRGTSCKALADGSLFCKYEIGKDLEFSITSVGEKDAGISFLRSSIKGDYWARFGVMHGCVIVLQGEAVSQSTALPFAFVSPKNGRVYKSWEECQRAR
jgi:hypothetical protein